jgi:hypothetical protein
MAAQRDSPAAGFTGGGDEGPAMAAQGGQAAGPPAAICRASLRPAGRQALVSTARYQYSVSMIDRGWQCGPQILHCFDAGDAA